ncbi:MAG: hypothetical protein ACLRS8_18320 [Parabacteroides merdae]
MKNGCAVPSEPASYLTIVEMTGCLFDKLKLRRRMRKVLFDKQFLLNEQLPLGGALDGCRDNNGRRKCFLHLVRELCYRQ